MFESEKSLLSELIRQNKYTYKAIGYQKLSITNAVTRLTVPSNARYAEMKLESEDSGVAARFLLLGPAGTQPSISDGIGLSALDVIDISSTENLINFRIIAAQSGTTTLHIQYYK